MSFLERNVVLLGLWLALWGEISIGNLLTGVAVVLTLSRLAPSEPSQPAHLHPVAWLRLTGHMAQALLTSSVRLAATAIRPTPDRLRAAIVEVQLEGGSAFTTMITSQLIGLTPGTLTVGITREDGPTMMYVHVLGAGDLDRFRDDVLALEQLVLAAHEPAPSRASE